GAARSDFEIDGVAVRAVDEMMAVGDAGLEAGGVAESERRFALVLDQHDLTLEHEDELVLLLMPMAERGRCAWLQCGRIDAELIEPCGIAETLARPAGHDLVVRRRITAACFDRKAPDVDLRHRPPHTRSMIVAVPMPPPMQSVTSAVR